MQIGSRWSAGEPPHPGVPEILHRAIRDCEAEHPEARSWTLTWLEGRPVCTLDDVCSATLTPNGEPMVTAPGANTDDEDDDWLR